MGVASYWILDPAGDGALTAFADERAATSRSRTSRATTSSSPPEPFPVTVVPARLLDGLRPRE